MTEEKEKKNWREEMTESRMLNIKSEFSEGTTGKRNIKKSRKKLSLITAMSRTGIELSAKDSVFMC